MTITAQEFNDKYFGANPTAAPFDSTLTVNWAGDPSTVTNNTPTSSPVNPTYCATSGCAADLAALLSDQGSIQIVEGPPLGAWPTANDYSQSGTVPFLQVTGPDGTVVKENAGLLANFFSHGYPANTTLAWVQNQIQMDLKAAAAPASN